MPEGYQGNHRRIKRNAGDHHFNRVIDRRRFLGVGRATRPDEKPREPCQGKAIA